MTDAQVDDPVKKEEAEVDKKTSDVNELKGDSSKKEDLAPEVEVKPEEAQKKEAEEDPFVKIEEERDSFKEKYYYLAAELENLRRRHEREKQNLVKFGNEKILSSLLTVVDNLELTLLAVSNEEDEKIKNIVTGIQMVRDQFVETLKNSGLEVIETNGKKFDPRFHEAISQKEVEGIDAGLVLEEVQKGYILNERVLRASKVITSK